MGAGGAWAGGGWSGGCVVAVCVLVPPVTMGLRNVAGGAAVVVLVVLEV